MDRIGRYKIVRELGRGAMGIVYHAIDPNIGRPVAIKTIQIGGGRKDEEHERLRERLFREARSAGILSHPGIVTIYDVEQQGELAYIAMEYVDGPTLDQLLSEPQPLAPNRIFSILAQTAAALDYAHGKGIVHRDIKPANIMIAADGTAKITDFGIAKINTSDQFTMTGSIVGTPHYMSPEQVQGQPVDGRSDQFSLSVIAYEMLTGEKPYTGEHLTTVVYKIVAEDPMAPHRINPSLGGGIDTALRKGLSKRPDARYKTCSEFIESLEKACAGARNWKPLPRGGSLTEPTLVDNAPSTAMPAARRTVRSGDTTTVERTARRKPGFLPFLAAILMAAALLALIGWQAGPWQGSAPAQTAHNEDDSTAATPTPTPATAPVTSAASSGPTTPPSTPVAGDAKPSALGTRPAEPATQAKEDSGVTAKSAPPEDVPRPVTQTASPPELPRKGTSTAPSGARQLSAGPQPIQLVTSPGSATVTLDGRPDESCTTPCAINASPGRHTLAFTLPGYQIEHRQVDIGGSPLEMPVVILHSQAGVLLLSSIPPGAAILVNGKAVTEVTPARLTLSPGTYRITLEKNGASSVNTVDIKNGDTRLLKVTLSQ
jgi:serine/threonine-protein kinase